MIEHGEAAADQLVHRGAQVEDLDRFFDRQVADEDAAVLLGAHQARLVEHAEGLAQRPARDAEAGGERHLGELLAGRSSPDRIIRSSSPWTTLESELVCRSVIVGCGGAAAAREAIGAVEAKGRRLSTISKKQLTSVFARTRLAASAVATVTELAYALHADRRFAIDPISHNQSSGRCA